MAGFIDITLVANAGVHLEQDGVGVLVDGMHHEPGPFSKVSRRDLERMRQGEPPFVHLDYLLFTHEHPDHFTPGLASDHLRHRPVKGLFLPDAKDGSPDLVSLMGAARAQGNPYHSLSLEPGQTRPFRLDDDLMITVIGTRHMGPQYQAIRNDCFLLSWKGMNILLTGDGDHVADYYAKALEDVRLDAVFVNPIFYHNHNGQAILNTIFRPRHVVIYHMPFAREDTMQFAYTVKCAMERYGRPDVQVHVLSNEHQQIRLFGTP